MKTEKKTEEQSAIDLLDQQYLEADNKEELDYWTPLAQIITESIAIRDAKGMTQADLAKKMQTRQSVISRFENMGRLPNYKFFAKLALALGHSPGMTLYGDYMAIVPVEKQAWIKEKANRKKMPTQRFVQDLLNGHLTTMSKLQQGDGNMTDAASSSVGRVASLSAVRGSRLQNSENKQSNPNFSEDTSAVPIKLQEAA